MSDIINVPMAAQRDIKTVTVEIRQLHRQGQEAALRYIVEIGRRLQEAKELLPHGEWGQWVKEELPFSQSTAQNFMRIFREYSADQLEIGGAVKSQALANLSYTKALKLLAIDDEEEREAFVEAHNVDDMSSRELEEAIRERDEARRMQAEAEKRAEGFEAQAGAAADRLIAAEKKAVDAAAEAEKKVAELNEALAKAKKQRDAARDKLKNAEAAVELLKQQKEDKPPQKENETTQKENETTQKENETPQEENEIGESAPAADEEELRRRIQAEEAAKAEEAVKALEAKVKEAEEKAEAMRVKLAMADPATAVFAQLFSDFGKCFEKLRGKYAEIVEKNGTEAAAKLKKAMQVQLQRFTEDVEARW